MTKYNLVTAPAIEPVTLTEAKTHLRVDSTADDTLITSMIVGAREAAEEYTGVKFITQTWQLFMDSWPYIESEAWWEGVREQPISYLQKSNSIEIDFKPLISVTHIKTWDNADASTTISSGNYQVSVYTGTNPLKGRITLRDGQSWPTFERNADGIEVQFVCGFGAATTDIPEQIRHALLVEIANRYENRGDVKPGLGYASTQLLSQYKTITL